MNIVPALAFNCPTCGAAIGEECISLSRGKHMAMFVHANRMPRSEGEYGRLKIRMWLERYAYLLTEAV
jgi:hypothetical protein